MRTTTNHPATTAHRARSRFLLIVPGGVPLCNCPTYERLVSSLGPPQAEKFLPRVTDMPKPEAL